MVIVPGVNFLFKFLRQGEADTWWNSRSIIAVGHKNRS
jgi:hypothetical protein